MTKDEIVEEMASKFEGLINACSNDHSFLPNLEPYREVLKLYHRVRQETKIPVQRFMAFWNGTPPLPMIKEMSAGRKIHLSQRAQEDFFVDHWQEGIQRIARSSFCLGKNDRGWRATVDWFLRPETLAKVMEGVYDSRTPVIGRNNSVVCVTPLSEDVEKWKKNQRKKSGQDEGGENYDLPLF